MFGRLHHLGPAAARHRAQELLERFGLAEDGGRRVRGFSGGMRRRLDLAAALVLAPPVLVLDEPTTGLDPRGRTEVWDDVRALVREGTTVLLTTQVLDEADQLADSVAVVDAGRVIAHGTPDELKAATGGDRLDVVVRSAADLPLARGLLEDATGAAVEVDADRRRLSAPVRDRVAMLAEALRALEDAGVEAEDVALRRPTLDEAFLRLTDREVAR
jgi:ABC-2 type transport system ATP-binding protein